MDKRMEEFFDPDAEVEENPEYEKWFDLFAGLSNDDLAKKRSLAAEKSINGAKPTTVELALFPYLFPDAQEYHHTAVSNAQSQCSNAALQATQHAPAVQAEPAPKGESLPFNYADDGERELHRIINICSKPASIIDNIKKLCNQSGSGWKPVNNGVAVFKFQRNDGFDDGQLQITLNSDAVRKQRDRLYERLGITKSDKLTDKSDKSDV